VAASSRDGALFNEGIKQMNNAIDRPHQALDALRIQAEIETANRAQTKRPTWAPAVVLDGELLELCRELEYLGPNDKPVARLWAVFADPRRKGAVIRSTYSQHVLPGIRCRGFELRAGIHHDGDRMTNALMDVAGAWSVGHLSWGHSKIDRMHRWASIYGRQIQEARRALQPRAVPHPRVPEESYKWAIERGETEKEVQRLLELAQKYNAEDLAHWEKREQEKQDPVFIERMREWEAKTAGLLEKLQKDIAKEEANPDWRYKALSRMTELSTQRLLAFVGDAQGERQRGARVTGACYICGKTLTDKLSLERGIGPECIQHLRTFDLTDLVRLKNEMVAAHPDKGGRHEASLAAYARYAEAKSAAERSLTY
jgi:hypothetical protein